MNQTELSKILNLHKLWLNDDPSGRRADLTNADLRNANLSGVILRNANLKNADLENADLEFANLSGVILRNANLKNADLTNAKLWYADLENADLEFANLSGADLSFVNLWYATFNKETVFPDGFNPIARGMKLIEEKVKVAAVPAAPKTLHEELAEVLAKHGLILGKTVTISINLLG